MNIAISIENEIIREGLIKIISDGVLISNFHLIDKNQLEESGTFQNFHLVIIDNKQLVKYLKKISKLIEENSKVKFFIFSSKKLSHKRIKMIEDLSIMLIKSDFSSDDILSLIESSFILNRPQRFQFKVKSKLLGIDPVELLSNRELQIAILMARGFTTKEISEENKLSMSTVSTYKSRIFQKTKTNNLVEMLDLFRY